MTVRVAVVGCGMIAEESYIPGILRMRTADLVALCSRSEERCRLLSARFGVPHYYTSLKALLEKGDFDLLVNLTPIQHHFAINLASLEASKHVFTEKSLAGTVEQATKLIETAKAKGVKFSAAPATMLAAVNQKVKRMIEEGAIGKVAFARVISSNGGPAYEVSWPVDPTWFYKKGAGPVHDMGVYGLHTITGILGPARRVTAFSSVSDAVRYVRGGPFEGKRIDVEEDDVTLIMLDFGNATFAMVDASFCVRATKSPSLVSMEVYGADGTIVASVWEAKQPLSIWRDDVKLGVRGWTDVEVDPSPWELPSGVEDIVDSILEDRDPVASGEHARHVLEIIEKSMVAARTGQAQELETLY